MNALRISLGVLLAVTLAYGLEKNNPSAASDAQPGSAVLAQEDGTKHAAKATWPFHAFLRRRHVTGPNERRNDGDAKIGARSQKIHRRSRRDDFATYDGDWGTWTAIWILLVVVLPLGVFFGIFASVGIGLSCYFKKRNNDPAYAGRVIQPAQPSAYPAQPMFQPYSE